MAFTQATLAQANVGALSTVVPNLWLYKTEDDITDLDVANYWAGAYARGVRAGDIVIAGCADGGVILQITALAAATSTAVIFA